MYLFSLYPNLLLCHITGVSSLLIVVKTFFPNFAKIIYKISLIKISCFIKIQYPVSLWYGSSLVIFLVFSYRDKLLRLTKIFKNEIGDHKNDQSLKWFVDIAGVSYSPFVLYTLCLLLLSIVMMQERKLFLISSQWLNGNLAELTYIDGILKVCSNLSFKFIAKFTRGPVSNSNLTIWTSCQTG